MRRKAHAPAESAVSTCRQSTVPSRASATALVSSIALPEKNRRCSAASVAIARLVEQAAVDADDAVAADHPSVGTERLTLSALAAASPTAIALASVSFAFSRLSSTSGDEASISTPAASSIERRIALVEARIRLNRTTLWINAGLGVAGNGGVLNRHFVRSQKLHRSRIHPRGQFDPQPVNPVGRSGATRASAERSAAARLLANSGSLA